MHIKTAEGWKPLHVRNVSPPVHVPSLLEAMGIDHTYNGPKEMARYANSSGHGYYYDYYANGTSARRQTQSD